MRIAFITSIPTPYQDPFLNVVAAQPGVELDVYYCAPHKADRPWEVTWELKYKAIHLPSINLAKQFGASASCYWNRGIIQRLREGNYNALVVCGYNHLTMLGAIFYAQRAKIPYYLSSEAFLKQRRSKWRVWVKNQLVRWVVKHAAGGLPTGTLASEYLVHYGAKPEHLTVVPNAPDVDHLRKEVNAFRLLKDQFKKSLGLGDEKVILFVSRLVKFKRLDILLKAFAIAFKDRPVRLVVLGNGVMLNSWQQLSDDLGLNEYVRFQGFIAPEELHKWHAIADLFVQPSESETWSVAVVEALASGVPVVVTDMVGCYMDMINDARIGRVVSANDPEQMAQAMASLIESGITAKEVAEIWAPVYRTVQYQNMAKEFVNALSYGVAKELEYVAS